jgi:hypothetical protein
VDVGTANIVVCRMDTEGNFVNRFHRNMLYEMDITDESSDLLEKSKYFFIKTDKKYYIIGSDALSLVLAIGKGEVIRCMKDGFLNPSLKESSELLFHIISSIVGKPIIENEPLRFSVPASPIDKDVNNIFHKVVLGGFFTKMGYSSKDINEAMAVCFNDNPIMKSNDGEEVPFSGISVSFGAGLQNLSLSFKGMSLVEFSCTKSGDYIDEMVSKVTGVSKSKVIRIKERELNLDKINTNDRVQVALGIYYDDLVSRVVNNISNQFKEKSSEMDGEIEIVVAGGTSMPNGFCARFEEAIKKSDIPFKIYRVRASNNPFNAVSQGGCLKAQSDYRKLIKK